MSQQRQTNYRRTTGTGTFDTGAGRKSKYIIDDLLLQLSVNILLKLSRKAEQSALIHNISQNCINQPSDGTGRDENMDDFQPHYQEVSTDTITRTSKSKSHEEKAIILASLLQELSFWEPSTLTVEVSCDGNFNCGLMRKSRSVNDTTVVTSHRNSSNSRNSHQRLLQHSKSLNESMNNNGSFFTNFNGTTSQTRHSLSSHENRNADATSQVNMENSRGDYSNSNIDDNHDSNMTTAPTPQQHPGSPTLAELHARCFWNKAIDPASGRTYYYDIRTRHTQWEKPLEIRAIEKRIKKDQRILDEVFFREMEHNLLSSLARGECIPVRSKPQQDQDDVRHVLEINNESPTACSDDMVVEPNVTPDKDTNGNGRIRTISCMNEHLLAQIQQPIQLQRVSSSNISKSLEGRPPLPSRPPPATTGSINNLPMVHSLPNNVTHDKTKSLPFTNNVTATENVTENEQHFYFTSANDDYDDLKLSPEESQRNHQLPTQDDVLRGEDLLDGALMLADLEVSDDEDANDSAMNEVKVNFHSNLNANELENGSHGANGMDVISTSINSIPINSIQPNSVVESSTKPKISDSNGSTHLSHIRRNTAGEGSILTTHMKGGTMEKPDIEGTIHVVCGVIRAHIEQSCQQTQQTPTPPHTLNVNLDIFRDDYHRQQLAQQPKGRSDHRALPTLEEIKEFYGEFYQRSQMEFDAIIMSLIYVERLIKLTNGAVMPSPYNWASVVFSCMVLASKVWDDLSMWNIDFSNVSVSSGVLSSFSLKRINELELTVLACLNFAVAIPGSEYAKYYYLLRSMMIRGGLLNPFAANQQLSKDTTIRLQDRTRQYQDSITLHVEEKNPRRRVRSVDWTA